MSSIVIYTAIFGCGRDILIDPIPISGIDYICFTDQPFESKVWKIKNIECTDKKYSPAILSKFPKVLPHKYLPEYDVSIWVDGNIIPKYNIVKMCKEFLFEKNMAIHKHPRRSCCYEEIEHLINKPDQSNSDFKKQMYRYLEYGMPKSFGLWECGVLFRRHNSIDVVNLMEKWMDQILNSNHARDQISFPYSLWVTEAQIFTINSDLRKVDYLTYNRHINEQYRRRIVQKTNLRPFRRVAANA